MSMNSSSKQGKGTNSKGNAGGSYISMRSREGAIFFAVNIIGSSGLFCDKGGLQPAKFLSFAVSALLSTGGYDYLSIHTR